MAGKKKTAGRVWASAHYAGNSIGDKDVQIEVRSFESPHATVKVAYGLTLNLGNYESGRVDAGVELPCYPEEVDDAFKEAWDKCEREVIEQVAAIRGAKADGRGE